MIRKRDKKDIIRKKEEKKGDEEFPIFIKTEFIQGKYLKEVLMQFQKLYLVCQKTLATLLDFNDYYKEI